MTFNPSDLPVLVTTWQSVKNPIGLEADLTWGVFLASKRFRQPATVASKTALAGWSPVAFAGRRRAKKCALRAYGVALDYEPQYETPPKDMPDGYVIKITTPGATLAEAEALWAPYYGLIHTTYGHMRAEKQDHSAEAGPRFRVILPLRRPVTPDEYAAVWAHVTALATAAGHPTDPSTKDISRLWFAPGIAPNGTYTAIDLGGDPLDPDPIVEAARDAATRAEGERVLREAARQEALAQARTRGAPVTGALLGPAPAGTASRRAYVERALERAVTTLRSAPHGTRNPELAKQAFALGGFVGSGELPEAEVAAALEAAVTGEGCNREAIRATIARCMAEGMAKPRLPPERQGPAPRAPVPERVVVYDEPPPPSDEPPEAPAPDEGPPDLFADADVVAPLPPRAPGGSLADLAAQIQAKADALVAGSEGGDPGELADLAGEIEAKAEALAAGDGGEGGGPPEGPPPSGSGRGGNWRDALIRDGKGKIKENHANTIVFLRDAPEWVDLIRYNIFADRIIATRCPVSHDGIGSEEWPRDWRDSDDLIVLEWLQRERGFDIHRETVTNAITTVAQRARFHPIRNYLDGLKWDGVSRIDRWLTTYYGADETKKYVSAVGACWLISAIARVRQPGCKADCMLVLEGEQGVKKSQSIKVLAGEWECDSLPEIGSKDSMQQLRGVWLIEMAEMDALGRAEISRIKAFLTTQRDRYRASYGRLTQDYERECVFVGTCNRNDYLRDDTGGRRFWPVAVKDIDIEGLARDRDQLWAEAQDQYSKGRAWWLEDDEIKIEASAEQDARYQTDAWEERVAKYLRDKGMIERGVSIGDVLQYAIDLEPGKWGRGEQMRASSCLKRLGWDRKRHASDPLDPNGPREWRYNKVMK